MNLTLRHSILLLTFLMLFAVFGQKVSAQEVTGLEGASIFLDPGHSQTENQGLYGYSEAEKVLRIGLALREMLLTQTDIDTVYIARTNDSQQVPLGQRDDLANATGADFYYSIHSNAGSSSTNNTLMLYGGWRKNGQTVEKIPNGGKVFGDSLIVELTDAMRIPTIGNFADRTFYQGFPFNHTNQWPYLHVNRTTNMASVLSEGGFHTNPFQQQRNLNEEYKRLEAQAAFWTIIDYFGATTRPVVGIATGRITEADDDEALNGATIAIDGKSYTTDTFESLFNKYSSDPNELKNGFYYLEGLTNGNQQIIVGADGFYSDTATIDVATNDFTFHDVSLISAIPPSITGLEVTDPVLINPGEDFTLQFSRKMNRESVEEAISLTPSDSIRLNWISDSRLDIVTNMLKYETEYVLKIDSTAFDASVYAHQLDGNADSVAGDSFVLEIITGGEDIQAPTVTDIYPTNTKLNELWPIASATFNEHLDTSKIDNSTIEIRLGTYSVPGIVKYYTVGERSVLNFFPSERLEPNKNYKLQFSGAISDTAGNSLGNNILRTFPTGGQDFVNEISIDNFESGLNAWWEPNQANQTTGIVAEETSLEIDTSKVNLLTGSTRSMRLNYGWRTSESENFIREYRGSVTIPKFDNQRLIQSYVFGDGSGNQFRFMLRDSNNQLEGSPWYTLDWIGWKQITWDLAQDSVIAWVNGDSVINGNSYFDSYQLTSKEGSRASGFVIFDDLRAVQLGQPVSNEEIDYDLPTDVQLSQNYPNPFNPSTKINFALPENGEISLKIYDMLGREIATLYEGVKKQGFHSIQFDASAYASGIYIYRLITETGSISKKMTLLK